MSASGRQARDGADGATWALSSLVVLSALAYLPLLLNAGLVNTRAGGDSPFLLVRVQQLVTALRAGVFPVRWMPDAAYGLGYPFFNYYAPLPFYFAALLRFLGLGIIEAVKATQVLGFLAAAAGMFLLARPLLSSTPAALLASLAYTYAPFHLINVYVRGDSLGEFYAFAFYPLVFLALSRLRRRPSVNSVAFLALAYGGLVLSHNLSAFIFSPFALVHALFLAFSGNMSSPRSSPLPRLRRAVRWLVWPLAGLVWGMGLSAWYWGPALLERSSAQLGQNLTGYFHYAGHFRHLDLVQPTLLFDYSITGQQTPFAMGLLQTLLVLLAILSVVARSMLRRRPSQSSSQYGGPTGQVCPLGPSTVHWLPFTGYWLLATVFITPLSRPIWDHLPLLPFVQFPWRFLSVQSFFGSLLIGYLATLPQHWRWRWVGASTLALVLLISAMAGLRVEYLPITDDDVTPERLALYELFTANIGSTVRAEYLPTGVEPRPYTSAVSLNDGQKPSPLVTAGQISQVQLLTQSPAEERWRINVSSPEAELAFFTLYFPGWRGYIDGRRVQIGPVKGSGLIRMRVPQGRHEVVLRFWLTRRRAAAEGLSLLAVLLVIGAVAWHSRVQRSAPSQQASGEATTLLVFTGIAFLLSVAVLWWTPRLTSLPPSPLSMDFARMPYLHANPGGVRFGDDLRLIDYDYPDRAHPGQAMDVTLHWADKAPMRRSERVPSDRQVEVALVSPAFHLFSVPDILARETIPLEPVTTHRLEIPPDVMPGPYLILVKVYDRQGELAPRTDSGEGLGATYLRPLSLDLPADSVALGSEAISEPEAVLGHFGQAIRLITLSYERTTAQWLRIDLTWWTGSAITANYKTSVRLKDEMGQTLVQADEQPLYGFYPTTAWRPGLPVADRRWLWLPSDLPPGDGYRIEVVMYEVPSLQALGTVEIGGVNLD